MSDLEWFEGLCLVKEPMSHAIVSLDLHYLIPINV